MSARVIDLLGVEEFGKVGVWRRKEKLGGLIVVGGVIQDAQEISSSVPGQMARFPAKYLESHLSKQF